MSVPIDLVARIQEGWFEFDTAIATPDMMGVGRKDWQASWPSRAYA